MYVQKKERKVNKNVVTEIILLLLDLFTFKKCLDRVYFLYVCIANLTKPTKKRYT